MQAKLSANESLVRRELRLRLNAIVKLRNYAFVRRVIEMKRTSVNYDN